MVLVKENISNQDGFFSLFLRGSVATARKHSCFLIFRFGVEKDPEVDAFLISLCAVEITADDVCSSNKKK